MNVCVRALAFISEIGVCLWASLTALPRGQGRGTTQLGLTSAELSSAAEEYWSGIGSLVCGLLLVRTYRHLACIRKYRFTKPSYTKRILYLKDLLYTSRPYFELLSAKSFIPRLVFLILHSNAKISFPKNPDIQRRPSQTIQDFDIFPHTPTNYHPKLPHAHSCYWEITHIHAPIPRLPWEMTRAYPHLSTLPLRPLS